MKTPKLKYKIEWATPHKKLKQVNRILIKGKDFDECLRVVYYDGALIREALSRIDKHSPDHIVFKFIDLAGPEILFTADSFQNLIDQWMEAMLEEGVEDYETAAFLRDFKL